MRKILVFLLIYSAVLIVAGSLIDVKSVNWNSGLQTEDATMIVIKKQTYDSDFQYEIPKVFSEEECVEKVGELVEQESNQGKDCDGAYKYEDDKCFACSKYN